MNQIRSVPLERGHIVPQGRARLAARLTQLLDGPTPAPSARMTTLVSDMRARWQAHDERIAAFDREFAEAAAQDKHARRLLTIRGVGSLNATAPVAAVSDASTFARGRDLAAWLGLVPRQATTGGKPRLLGITKRGSLSAQAPDPGGQGSHATLRKTDTRLGAWPRRLLARAHPNTAVVALAAKLARIVWALLRHERAYDAGVAGLNRSTGSHAGPTRLREARGRWPHMGRLLSI